MVNAAGIVIDVLQGLTFANVLIRLSCADTVDPTNGLAGFLPVCSIYCFFVVLCLFVGLVGLFVSSSFIFHS